jgi:AcrR family transcriptional regulator
MPRVSEATRTENRARLLAAAADAFAEHGLHGARIDDISLAAGLAKGTVYNYFDSKEHLFREVIAAWQERIAACREAIDESAPIRDRLMAIVAADMVVMAEIEPFARTAFREVLSPAAGSAVELIPASDPLDEEIRATMELGLKRGELRADRTVDELAQLFAAAINGLLIERWLPGPTLELDDIRNIAVDHFLDGAVA